MSTAQEEPGGEPRERPEGDAEREPAHDPLDGLVFDEAFIAAATIKEPTARQRKGNSLSRWRAARRTRRRGRYTKTGAVVISLATVGVLVAVMVRETGFRPGLWGGGSGGHPAETAPVTAGPTPTIRLDDPFAGSRAAGFADGAAGITLPKATAKGGFAKAEVARFARRSRDLLIASQLDRRTLLGGSPDAFARKLDPEQRPHFVRHLDHKVERKRTRDWVTSFAPGSAQLAGKVIKVNGTTKTSVADRAGRHGILVTFNYLFVYPIHRPGEPSTLTRVVAHFEGEVFNYREAGSAHSWVWKWGASAAPSRCDVNDGFVHPYYPGKSEPDKVKATGAPMDPYDLETREQKDGGEGRGTGCTSVQPT